MRKAGLEVGEDLSNYGPTQMLGRRLGRRPTSQQGGANEALAAIKASEDALEGFVAALELGSLDGGEDGVSNAADEGVLEESPQGFCGQAQSSDCAGNPDALANSPKSLSKVIRMRSSRTAHASTS